MIQQPDSLAVNSVAVEDTTAAAVMQPREETPSEVTSWSVAEVATVRKDTTVRRTTDLAVTNWLEEPDTLEEKEQAKDSIAKDKQLLQYYQESFFSSLPMYDPELAGGRRGIAGDPKPYTIGGDDLFTSLLLGCFVLTLFSIARLRDFIVRQTKNFFHTTRKYTTGLTETSGELWFQLFLTFQASLFLAIIFYFYTYSAMGQTFTIESYQMVGLYLGVILLYFLVRGLLNWWVIEVFFNHKKTDDWVKSYLYLISLEGVFLFPIVMLLAYFDLSLHTALTYTAIVVIFIKILTFYKTYLIFFREKGGLLQNFVYFCALEIAPMLFLWALLVTINSHLIIDF